SSTTGCCQNLPSYSHDTFPFIHYKQALARCIAFFFIISADVFTFQFSFTKTTFMKSIARSLLLLFVFVGLLTACKKAVPKETRFIPKNANFVVTINGESLVDKLKNSQADIEKILKNTS